MVIENKIIECEKLKWILRCPPKEDATTNKNIFLVAEVEGKIIRFARCEGNK